MRESILDYEDLARATDALREMVNAMVAGLVSDGFTNEQARDIVAGSFRAVGESNA